MDKMKFKLLPPNTEIQEMLCSPSEMAHYNKRHAAPGSATKK
jgi:hypothetical protein